MGFVVDACGGVLRGVGVGGQGLGVRADLVVGLEVLGAGRHGGRLKDGNGNGNGDG